MTQAQVSAVRLPARSLGRKLLMVCGLALLMTVPALCVFTLLYDRTHRAEQVVQELGGLFGGRQTFLGPVLAVPYTTPPPPAPPYAPGQPAAPAPQPGQGVYLIYPIQGSAKIAVRSEVRRRSLFSVPVYRADVGFQAAFDLSVSPQNAPVSAALDWTRAELLMGASDLRGAQADGRLRIDGRLTPVSPSSLLIQTDLGTGGRWQAFGARGLGLSPGSQAFSVTADLKFSGAQRLAVLPFAKSTTLAVAGDWASPGYDGGFLPQRHKEAAGGFDATWSIPFLARGVPAEGASETLTALGPNALGVSFVEPANPYQAVARSLKYALLFIGLVFLAYFVFEATTGRRVHPAQYVLVGLAQVVFYLLLLSIAERVGFDGGFLAAAIATVGLISLYAGWVFESRTQGLRALGVFGLLYALIYGLMRLEDLALLVGAFASFAAIAAVMYFTRRLDWYDVASPIGAPSTRPSVHTLEG